MIAPRRGPGVPARALDALMLLAVGRLGLPLPGLWILRVRSRRTGRVREVPVLVPVVAGRRYLLAPRGETGWVRDLRAHGGHCVLRRGRRCDIAGTIEVAGDERAVVVGAYARRYRWLSGRFFALPRRFDAADVARIAGRHPTFRLEGPAAAGVPAVRVAVLLALLAALGGPDGAAAAEGDAGTGVLRTQERPSYVVAPGALPAGVAEARAILRDARARSAEGSMQRADLDWVLRLGRAHLGPRDPHGRRATVALTLRVNAWWYSRYGSPRERVLVRHPDGILSTYWEGRGLAVNPVASAGRWQGLNAEVASEALAEALRPLGARRRAGARAFALWEYYDVPDAPRAVRPGASGMAQGRIAQLMARAYYRTGEPRFAEASRAALAAFTVPVGHGGVTSRVGPGAPWYVERAYPGASPWRGAALNGFMVSLLNLRATAQLLDARPRPLASGPREVRARARAPGARAGAALALGLARRGEATLARHLPQHDTGDWSLYGLLTPGYPWRGFVADLGYHCYHVTLLRQLDAVAPERRFARTADRWARYVDARGLRCPRGGAAGQSEGRGR